MGRYYVCSDIHLGLPISQSDFFYRTFIPRLQAGDTLILLGDILDFWISSHEIQFQQVVINWKDLHDCLTKVKARGVNIKYVPGNHDSFVFYTESRDVKDFDWSKWVFKFCNVFHNLYDQTQSFRLASLCDIHYPFHKVKIGHTKYLFTHGHWIELMWKILSGDPEKGAPEGRLPKFWVVAKALMTCIVHSNAPDLRRVFTKHLDHDDAFELTRRVEDVSYCILADVLRKNRGVGTWGPGANESPRVEEMEHLAKEMSDAFQKDITDVNSGNLTRDRQACIDRGRKLLEQWLNEDSPADQVDRVKTALLRQPGAYNYTIRRSGETATVTYEDLVTFSDFDVLVFGHFHRPRFSHTAIDEGCMLQYPKNTTIQSYLVIEPDGTAVPSWQG